MILCFTEIIHIKIILVNIFQGSLELYRVARLLLVWEISTKACNWLKLSPLIVLQK